MYNHKEKVAWWKDARTLLQAILFAALLIAFIAGGGFLNRFGFAEATATVTEVSEVCEARKTRFRGLTKGFIQTERIDLPCEQLQSDLWQGLQDDGYRLVQGSRIEFEYRSPADDRVHTGYGILEVSGVSVGDRIMIGASTKDAGSTRIDW